MVQRPRPDLRGGRRVTGVPTASVPSMSNGLEVEVLYPA